MVVQAAFPVQSLLPFEHSTIKSRDHSAGGRPIDQGEQAAQTAAAAFNARDIEVHLDGDLAAAIETTFGIDVAIEPIEHGFDGLAWSQKGCRLIVVGTPPTPGRQRFTLAHELGHLLFDDGHDLHVDENVYSKRRDEMRANAFAAALLMPDGYLAEHRSDLGSDASCAEMVSELGVTPTALAWRSFNLSLIDEQRRDSLLGMSSFAAAVIAGEESDFAERVGDAERRRVPSRLLLDALRAYTAGQTTFRPFAALLGKDPRELREMMESDDALAGLLSDLPVR